MELADCEAISWLQSHTRDPLPKRVVWLQDDVLKNSFYWLAVPEGVARKGHLVIAEIHEQTIRIKKAEGPDKLKIRLNDQMLDLDKPVVVKAPDDSILFSGRVQRSRALAERTLKDKGDRKLMFFAEVEVVLGGG